MCKTYVTLKLKLANAQHDYTFFARARSSTSDSIDKAISKAALAKKTTIAAEIMDHEKQCQACRNEKLFPIRNPKVGLAKPLLKSG